MRKGKLREPQLKRSILRVVKKRIENIIPALDIGTDSARIITDKDIATAMSLCDINICGQELIAVNRSIDNIVASGAIPIGFMPSILLPEKTEESVVREIMKSLEAFAADNNLQIMGGHTEFLSSIVSPVISVTAYGEISKDIHLNIKNVKPDMDIVMTKWAGLEGSGILANMKEEELVTKYPKHYITSGKKLLNHISTIPEARALIDEDIAYIHDVSTGGVFATLWEMSSNANVGTNIQLKDIPIKQETVEICEFFNINPYMLRGNGSLIIVCDDGEKITEKLLENNIYATVIGRTTNDNDKVVIIEEEKRFLTPPKGDEINKVL